MGNCPKIYYCLYNKKYANNFQDNTLFVDFNENDENKIIRKCLICLEYYDISFEFNYTLDCGCIIHQPCFDDFIRNSIQQGKFPIKCPYCNNIDINEKNIRFCLSQYQDLELFRKFDHLSINYYIMQHPDEASCCPTPGCDYAFIYEKVDDHFSCPLCEKEYCLKCKSDWHRGKTCKEYRKGLKNKNTDDSFYKFANGKKFKQCPYCKFWVEKNEGCNHIACRCGNHFCYKCGKKMNGHINDHVCR